MRPRMLLGLVVAFALGCGGPKLAPVSGTVTLDGKPLAGATVSFLPMTADKTSREAPLGSTGKTNDKGEYTLETPQGQKGALVGKHRVSVTLIAAQVGEGDERPPRGGWPMKDKVPTRYSGEQSELSCDVPDGGTTKADFALKSTPDPKKPAR